MEITLSSRNGKYGDVYRCELKVSVYVKLDILFYTFFICYTFHLLFFNFLSPQSFEVKSIYFLLWCHLTCRETCRIEDNRFGFRVQCCICVDLCLVYGSWESLLHTLRTVIFPHITMIITDII